MNTIIIKVDPESPEPDKIEQAANFIRRGGLVAFPTETVYGLGADALNAKAVRKIFEAKNRPADNPLIIHVSNLEHIEEVAELNEVAEKIIHEFFPGPIAVIMKKKEIVPPETSGGYDKIAVRMPDNKVALALIDKAGVIVGPSANIAGKPSPTTAEHVIEDLGGKIDAIIDAGETETGLESTVIDTTTSPPEILRPGPITAEMIEKLTDVEFGEADSSKYVHYSTNAEMIVLTGNKTQVKDRISSLTSGYRNEGKLVGLITLCKEGLNADVIIELNSPEAFAKNIFSALRELDKKVDVILVEGIEEVGLGVAVMDRLKKGAGRLIIL